ncbi:MAG TPA: DUF1015 domain-containing protein [Anaerolineaceae bacterium]|uniref:DUF1015 domain-containing protein n=1 Tax=Anaerolinea thermophila TaxID=167964 RepID=A0A101FXU2_9CHLR|nr:MAG: hypothetical protein XD73_0666 [Anaerolinea thermophila]HAF62056.1 DUF1015 domain-containing protein [Anaerolineaceae bacterium]
MQKEHDNAYQKPVFLLPNETIDLHKWAVIACDQFTSQPEYWQEVEQIVGDSPSTYRMILPEAYLDTPRAEMHSQQTYQSMQAYLSEGIFKEYHGYVLIERKLGSTTRRGLLLNLDLEQYDFHEGSQSLIRATEGTILDRLPPRIKIREKALLEIPHIMILIDDREDKLFSYLHNQRTSYQKIYDFSLMQNSGSIQGFLVDHQGEEEIDSIFRSLRDPNEFSKKYNLQKDVPPLLFAVGDGNHSLATAKSIWENIKNSVPPDHPARYALVEVVNIHDESLVFEPIHRVLFNYNEDILSCMQTFFKNTLQYKEVDTFDQLQKEIHHVSTSQKVGLLQNGRFYLVQFNHPTTTLAVGTLQHFLDHLVKENPSASLDYVHGDTVLQELSTRDGNIGFLLPAMQKNDFFRTVILDGSLPRKTFSMGDAREKRFYLECRKIQ